MFHSSGGSASAPRPVRAPRGPARRALVAGALLGVAALVAGAAVLVGRRTGACTPVVPAGVADPPAARLSQ